MPLAARVRRRALALTLALTMVGACSILVAQPEPAPAGSRFEPTLDERIQSVAARFARIRSHANYRHWTGFDEVTALSQARLAPSGPLTGLMVAVKDNIDLSWLATSAGASALRNRRPPRNASVVDRLLGAGAVVAGHTNMDTWARGVRSVSETTGATANALNPTRGPMGSSGGSAVAVALGEVDGALGTDTCGSLRYPAAANVIVALRPTPGLVSRAGVVPLAPTQDVVGPMARNVRTLARLLDVIAGPDPRDPLTQRAPRPDRTYTEHLEEQPGPAGALPRRWRVGVVRTLGQFRRDSTGQTMLDKMGAAGIDLVNVSMPTAPFSSVIDDESAATRPLVVAGADESRWLVEALRVPNRSGYASRLRDRKLSASRLTALLDGNRLDALAYPTTPFGPAPRGERQASANCQFAATSGLPALALGHGVDADNVAVPGVDLLGREFDESTLLRLGLAITEP